MYLKRRRTALRDARLLLSRRRLAPRRVTRSFSSRRRCPPDLPKRSTVCVTDTTASALSRLQLRHVLRAFKAPRRSSTWTMCRSKAWRRRRPRSAYMEWIKDPASSDALLGGPRRALHGQYPKEKSATASTRSTASSWTPPRDGTVNGVSSREAGPAEFAGRQAARLSRLLGDLDQDVRSPRRR